MIRPDGTLALPYLDAALTRAGYDSTILDMSVGGPHDRLEDTFYNEVAVSPKLVRVGMTPDRILEYVRDYDVIAITSIFTPQTSRCFEVGRLIKQAYPEKVLIAGGVNARSLRHHFLKNGFDCVFLSESENVIVDFARYLETGDPPLEEIEGIAYMDGDEARLRPMIRVAENIDDYAMPSWHKLPNEKYWEISRIFGGKEGWIDVGEHPRYAAVFTSRGCPFRCTYCHISKERGFEAGEIANLRLHSIERVHAEFEQLRDLGVDTVYINDDSFLAKKPRVHTILEILRDYDFRLADVNGVNIVHLFKRHNGSLVVDEELLYALHAAGFRRLSIPFESGNQRVIDKYSSGKWRIDECDVVELIRRMTRIGVVASGNFMIGYPDETLDELTDTFMLARRAIDAGLHACSFFMVQPFPGTLLFEESIANGQLPRNWHWDELGWSKGSPFLHPVIDKNLLKYCWSLVWKLLNRESRIDEITGQLVAIPEGESARSPSPSVVEISHTRKLARTGK